MLKRLVACCCSSEGRKAVKPETAAIKKEAATAAAPPSPPLRVAAPRQAAAADQLGEDRAPQESRARSATTEDLIEGGSDEEYVQIMRLVHKMLEQPLLQMVYERLDNRTPSPNFATALGNEIRRIQKYALTKQLVVLVTQGISAESVLKAQRLCIELAAQVIDNAERVCPIALEDSIKPVEVVAAAQPPAEAPTVVVAQMDLADEAQIEDIVAESVRPTTPRGSNPDQPLGRETDGADNESHSCPVEGPAAGSQLRSSEPVDHDQSVQLGGDGLPAHETLLTPCELQSPDGAAGACCVEEDEQVVLEQSIASAPLASAVEDDSPLRCQSGPQVPLDEPSLGVPILEGGAASLAEAAPSHLEEGRQACVESRSPASVEAAAEAQGTCEARMSVVSDVSVVSLETPGPVDTLTVAEVAPADDLTSGAIDPSDSGEDTPESFDEDLSVSDDSFDSVEPALVDTQSSEPVGVPEVDAHMQEEAVPIAQKEALPATGEVAASSVETIVPGAESSEARVEMPASQAPVTEEEARVVDKDVSCVPVIGEGPVTQEETPVAEEEVEEAPLTQEDVAAIEAETSVVETEVLEATVVEEEASVVPEETSAVEARVIEEEAPVIQKPAAEERIDAPLMSAVSETVTVVSAPTEPAATSVPATASTLATPVQPSAAEVPTPVELGAAKTVVFADTVIQAKTVEAVGDAICEKEEKQVVPECTAPVQEKVTPSETLSEAQRQEEVVRISCKLLPEGSKSTSTETE